MTDSDVILGRIFGRTRRDGSCRIWQGAVNGAGRPRIVVDGREADPRRYVYADVYGTALPKGARLRSLCGRDLCVSRHCVSTPADGRSPEDFAFLACDACGNSVGVLRAVYSDAWCTGGLSRGPEKHPARRMRARL
jgi:hypothetical protein